ncbi:hypothetical protein OCK72_04645 [Fusobacterium simiae]|uniref:DUF2971 domain-containing protein n=1 Tax=Fusobacterium simiae TaxID=855 RepID=A0ABT4DH87_FUSSI|nr:DUF6678 family protein [Fusobacterium simiae]MCY7007946.1 hypothetical protein [Fusobacterium simiae]
MFENLNPRSAEIISNKVPEKNESSILYNLKWKDNIQFLLYGNCHLGWYYILKNNEQISPSYNYRKIDDILIKNMQKIIDEIESGKYKNKKTPSEKIRLIVEKRKLYSLMNNTKWRELIKAIKEEMYDIPIKYKTLFEEKSPSCYWTMAGDEHFEYLNMASVEWFKISTEIKVLKSRGRLIEDKFIVYDKKAELHQILERFHIPFEYDEEENAFVVYGYR